MDVYTKLLTHKGLTFEASLVCDDMFNHATESVALVDATGSHAIHTAEFALSNLDVAERSGYLDHMATSAAARYVREKLQ